jgi:hypothetical protein
VTITENQTLRNRLLARVSVKEPDECWNWTGAVVAGPRGGYGQLGCGAANSRSLKAHRASWLVHIGPIPHGLHVLHKCDNRRCCNPAHLYLGTHQQNMRDMHERGRTVGFTSENNPRAKLTPRKAYEVRWLLAQGWKGSWIARDFGISKQSVYAIRDGKSYA